MSRPRGEILEAYLFGSRATGRAHADSDVDVAVYLAEERPAEAGLGYAASLAADLMRVLGTSAVDVVVLNSAGPLLYRQVLRHGRRPLA